MFAAFAGAGVLEGIGQGMLHERNLKEAIDTSHKELWDKENAAEALSKAQQDDKTTHDLETKYRNQYADTAIKKYNTAADTQLGAYVGSGEAAGQQMPGVPAPMGQGSIQPQTPPLMAQNQPPQEQGGPMPQMPPLASAAPPPAPMGGMNSPQGGEVPLTPPSSEDIHPASPAAAIQGGMALKSASQSQDPYEAIAVGMGHTFKDGPDINRWNQEGYDMMHSAHAQFPALSPEALAAGVKDYLGGAFENKEKFLNFMQKQNENTIKDAGKGPIAEDKLSTNEQNRYTALKNNGDLPDAPVQVQNLTPTEHNIRSKNAMVAQRVEQGSATALDSLLRQAGLQGKYDSGIGASTLADFSNTVSSWLGAGQTDKAAAVQQMGKESIDSMVSMMQTMPPGTRQGAQMAKYDLQGVADTVKGAAPNLQVINSLFAKSLMNSQNAFIQRTAGRYENQEQIDQLSARYTENNPPFLSDGTTPNPKWVSAKDWIAQGGPPSNITTQGNMTEGRGNIATKRDAAVQGQNPSEVGNTAKFDYSKIEKGAQYTAPDGSIRTKQ